MDAGYYETQPENTRNEKEWRRFPVLMEIKGKNTRFYTFYYPKIRFQIFEQDMSIMDNHN